MDIYQVAIKLVPESKELAQKIHMLRNQIQKQAKAAKLVSLKPSGTIALPAKRHTVSRLSGCKNGCICVVEDE